PEGFVRPAKVEVTGPQVRTRAEIPGVELQGLLVPRDSLLELLVVVQKVGELEPWSRIAWPSGGLVFKQLDGAVEIDRRVARRQRLKSRVPALRFWRFIRSSSRKRRGLLLRLRADAL